MINEPKFNLKKIFYWSLAQKERMKWLAAFCEYLYSLKDESALSQILYFMNMETIIIV